MKELKTEFEKKINCLKDILVSEISKSSRIFIVPHKDMDFDALASATILYTICKLNRKEVYIVSNDNEDKMKSSIRHMYKELKIKCKFITTQELNLLRTEDELVILTDVNSECLIPITNIETFKNIIIVDHHNTDSNTVRTDKCFIDTQMSSASELLFYLMKNMDIYIDTYLAQLLLAGIYLDTGGLHYLSKPFTVGSLAKILEYGANLEEVQDLFVISNFEDDRKKEGIINKLIDCTNFIRESDYTLAFTSNDNDIIYEENHLAETADRMLKYKFDAAFILGFIDKEELGKGHKNLVCVKARSKSSDIDVSKIMDLLGGGGDHNRGSSIIETDNIHNIKDFITLTMRPGITREEIDQKLLNIKCEDKPKIYIYQHGSNTMMIDNNN